MGKWQLEGGLVEVHFVRAHSVGLEADVIVSERLIEVQGVEFLQLQPRRYAATHRKISPEDRRDLSRILAYWRGYRSNPSLPSQGRAFQSTEQV